MVSWVLAVVYILFLLSAFVKELFIVVIVKLPPSKYFQANVLLEMLFKTYFDETPPPGGRPSIYLFAKVCIT